MHSILLSSALLLFVQKAQTPHAVARADEYMKRALDQAKQLNGNIKEMTKNTAVEDEPEELRGMCDTQGTLFLVDDATRRVFAAERDDDGMYEGG